ncbi:hypothetical protein P7H17_13390 [Paenibacillus larvae]|nr:hypothetical protein [Paenibacillus larvae]MDT2258772.1 hypothetical protein [Paenibacillus larvae]MDT2262860.1 hypothetical protein [Paenibacillus larvae]MDT2274267.1 hypothetical protein [Paenibacillus larvae]MDT2286834.1 hypothetical protein [Paenibacillus larvae]MDT2294432.1 hypothetical protein [Paenibacillus larvae]
MIDSEKKTGQLYPFFIILKRDFINLITNIGLIVTNTLFPLLLILTLGYLGGVFMVERTLPLTIITA